MEFLPISGNSIQIESNYFAAPCLIQFIAKLLGFTLYSNYPDQAEGIHYARNQCDEWNISHNVNDIK